MSDSLGTLLLLCVTKVIEKMQSMQESFSDIFYYHFRCGIFRCFLQIVLYIRRLKVVVFLQRQMLLSVPLCHIWRYPYS